MEPAQKAGFRAPLIGGGMGVHFLMAELWQRINTVVDRRPSMPKSIFADLFFGMILWRV